MVKSRTYPDEDDDVIVTLQCPIRETEHVRWDQLSSNRDEGWVDKEQDFHNMELDSFTCSETTSKEFDDSKSVDHENSQVGNNISYICSEFSFPEYNCVHSYAFGSNNIIFILFSGL